MSRHAARAADGPQRTCLGCRQVRPKAALVRLVRRPDGIVVADPHGPGRGAYVCASAACVERATKRLALAFRQASRAAADLVTMVREAGRAVPAPSGP